MSVPFTIRKEIEVRQEDSDKKCYFRSPERVFHMNGSWYFATREGEQGPYPSEQQAHVEILRFISEKTELAKFQKEREAEHARSLAKISRKLELVMPEDRPRIRPSQPVVLQRKVYI